ncbi:MAG: hypothetical protein AB1472_07740 [Candidatus Omnitrophota bacterium]
MEDNPYFVVLTPEEFHWLWEDIELALQSAQKKTILKDEDGKLHDLTDYKMIKLLKELKVAFEKADREHKCVDEVNQLSS